MFQLNAYYHQIQKHCAYSDYDAISNIPKIGKWYLSLISSRHVWILQTQTTLTSNYNVQNLSNQKNVMTISTSN